MIAVHWIGADRPAATPKYPNTPNTVNPSSIFSASKTYFSSGNPNNSNHNNADLRSFSSMPDHSSGLLNTKQSANNNNTSTTNSSNNNADNGPNGSDGRSAPLSRAAAAQIPQSLLFVTSSGIELYTVKNMQMKHMKTITYVHAIDR